MAKEVMEKQMLVVFSGVGLPWVCGRKNISINLVTTIRELRT
jgi:hypothetical protein